MINQKELIRKWVAMFVESKGGPREVSRETGLDYMVLRHLNREERFPSWDVLSSLYRRWPNEISLNDLAGGNFNFDALNTASKQDIHIQNKLKELEEELERLLAKQQSQMKFLEEMKQKIKP